MKELLQRKRIISKLLVFILMASIVLSGFVYSQEPPSLVETGQDVGPGTYYKNMKYVTPNGRYVINTLEAAVGTEYLSIEASDGGSPIVNRTVSAQALQKSGSGTESRVIGAVNGDFFDMTLIKGLTYGTSIVNGEIKASVASSPVFGVKQDGSCFIDTLNMDAAVSFRNMRLPVTSVNKLCWLDQTIIYTPAFGITTANTIATTDVVVRGIAFPLQPNQVYTGWIEKVLPNVKATEIPADGVVISVNGSSAEAFLSAGVGESISFEVNYDEADLKHVVSGGPRLVENGMPSADIPSRADAKERHPRTAIGLKDGKLYMVTVDGRQTGVSDGMSLYELTEFLIGQGVKDAINLDGGGSTAMVVRKQGNMLPTLVNTPSDGRERSIGNSIQLVSTAPMSEPAIIRFNEQDIQVFKNSSFKPTFSALDRYYNPVQLDSSLLKYSADPKTAKVSKDGIFTAGSKTGTSFMEVAAGNAKSRLPVRIVDKISKLFVLNDFVHLDPGEKEQLWVKAYDENGKAVMISPEAVKWEITGGIGKVDSKGVFTAGTKAGSGKIRAKLGAVVSELDARVGKTPTIVADFANLKVLEASAVRGTVAVRQNQAQEPVKSGKISLRMDYDFTNTEGTSAAYITFKTPVKIIGKPTELGVWLYGNGSGHWVRGVYTNARGERKLMNLTEEKSGVNFKGWKFVYVDIPADEAFPIALTQLYVAEPGQDKKDKGALYFDDVIALYKPDPDYFSPVVTETLPGNGEALEAPPAEITIAVSDKGKGIDPDSVKLLVNDKQVKAKFDAENGKIIYAPSEALPQGEYNVKLTMKDKAGNVLNPEYSFKFTVQ